MGVVRKEINWMKSFQTICWAGKFPGALEYFQIAYKVSRWGGKFPDLVDNWEAPMLALIDNQLSWICLFPEPPTMYHCCLLNVEILQRPRHPFL